MSRWPAYQAAGRCTGRTPSGSKALMEWALYDFRQGARNSGIYVCRSIRGSSNRSLHGEGRAIDVGFGGYANPAGTRMLNTLLPHVGTLGIQMIIWNRRIYSARYPRGKRYTGVNPHTDHLHIELTWHAANHLTRGRIQQVIAGGGGLKAPPPRRNASWSEIRRWNAGLLYNAAQHLPPLHPKVPKNAKGFVKVLQESLNIVKNAKLKTDGKYGNATFMHVADFQNQCRKLGLPIRDPQGHFGDTTKWWLVKALENIKNGKG